MFAGLIFINCLVRKNLANGLSTKKLLREMSAFVFSVMQSSMQWVSVTTN